MSSACPVSSPPPVAPSSRCARWLSSPDGRAIAVLAVVTALVAWNRLTFDAWLADFDDLTFYLPWYAFLGERLRHLAIPGWNPYLFSGTPFAADPQSGWMYLPAMLFFPLLPAVAAFKAMVVFQFALAAASTYALARALRLGAVAALVAAAAYAFGLLLQQGTYGGMIAAELATWLPLALLGVELAMRADCWQRRVPPCAAGALAISQILAGWLGQGAMYGLLAIAGYVGYRLLAPAVAGRRFAARLALGAATGIAILVLGLAFAAAGLLPRLAAAGETNLAGGRYSGLGAAGRNYGAMPPGSLLLAVAGSGFPYRESAWGGGVVALSILALVLARRRFAVPYFAALTVVCLVLTLPPTPLHRLFYLIPRFRELHEHDQSHILVLAPVGAAMLSGAAVEALPHRRGDRRLALPIGLALLLLIAAAAVFRHSPGFVGWPSVATAAAALALAGLVVAAPRRALPAPPSRLIRAVPILLLAIVLVQPTGAELAGSWLGWPPDASWAPHWHPAPDVAVAVAANVASDDPGGAGEFLRRVATGEPFRYVGYGGYEYPGDAARRRTYMTRRFDPHVTALLVNGRPIFLGLYDIQGYDPVQLQRYVEFTRAMNNGAVTDYDIAYLLPSGTRSPLLNLLSVRYIVIDASLPAARPDVAALTAGRRPVFRNDLVVVYENAAALPHAWIVHDVRVVPRGGALPLLAGGVVDPRTTALVEGQLATGLASSGAADETARVTEYAPDRLTVETHAAGAGLLVISDVYAAGWRATVDGHPAPILPTDHVLRGVPIPAGDHRVVLRYDPPGLTLGLAITAVATVAMAVGLVLAWLGRVRSRGAGEGSLAGDRPPTIVAAAGAA